MIGVDCNVSLGINALNHAKHYQEIVGKLFTSACSTMGAPLAT